MNQHSPLLFDGATGTYYASRFGDDIPCELAALRHPDRIAAIHREYLLAGAQAITTDTFRADSRSLGIGPDEVLQIVDAAWRIACDAAGETAQVWAGFGPAATDDGEEGPEADDERLGLLSAEDEMLRKADRFIALGARRFLFETCSDAALPLRICAHIKSACPEAATLVSFAVSPDGTARSGHTGADLARAACSSPHVDLVGFNCVSGPTHLLQFIKTLRSLGILTKPVSVMPNAGYPTVTEGRTVYRNNPDYFADTLAAASDAGIAILGGCCGTTPAHIAALASRMGLRGSASSVATSLTVPGIHNAISAQPAAAAVTPVRAPAVRNRFREMLDSGRTVLLAELDPPANADPALVPAHAAAYRDAGADIVTVADNPLGWARADVAVTAARIRRECFIDAMPHLTCRDRNRSAIRSQLIALHNEGIRNVLVVTGDPVPADLAADTRGVFHMNSAQLMAYVGNLNESMFDGDGFTVGGALNLGAANFDTELERARRKIQNGAVFFITQPVFGDEGLRRLAQARTALDTRLIAGILPVVSYRNAMFLNNEVHGINIPETMVTAYQGKSPEESASLGVRFALDTIRGAAGLADGFHLVTPLKKTGMVAEILRLCRTEPLSGKGVPT